MRTKRRFITNIPRLEDLQSSTTDLKRLDCRSKILINHNRSRILIKKINQIRSNKKKMQLKTFSLLKQKIGYLSTVELVEIPI